MLKNIQVVMLATKEKAEIQLAIDNTLRFTSNHTWIYQHLYFLSDEEMKEGDWVINEVDYLNKRGKIIQLNKEEVQSANHNKDVFKKIIATTDSSLEYSFGKTASFELPHPSQEFLEVFVKEYNKGNQIKEVLVEYEEKAAHEVGLLSNRKYRLKVNSKDNTITTKRAKETFTKQEAMELCIGYAMWCAFECNSPEQYLIQNIGVGQVPKMYSKEQVANLLYATWNHAVEVSHATHIKTNDPLFKDWLEQNL